MAHAVGSGWAWSLNRIPNLASVNSRNAGYHGRHRGIQRFSCDRLMRQLQVESPNHWQIKAAASDTQPQLGITLPGPKTVRLEPHPPALGDRKSDTDKIVTRVEWTELKTGFGRIVRLSRSQIRGNVAAKRFTSISADARLQRGDGIPRCATVPLESRVQSSDVGPVPRRIGAQQLAGMYLLAVTAPWRVT